MPNFIYNETSDSVLKPVTDERILNGIIDQTTNKPYNGIILYGEFASLTGELNNNNRIYDIPSYLEFISLLKNQIHSPKGLYGELEHPEGYQTNLNNVSHKILDIFYDENNKKVMGYVLLLNTVKGKIAQEIIKSGGELGISARGGGSEDKQPDGTLLAKLKLLVTYDLVYHPGFSTSIVKFKNLNESRKIDSLFESVNLNLNINKLNESEIIEKLNIKNSIINLEYINNNLNESFLNPYQKFDSFIKLFESKKEEESDIQTLQKNQSSSEDKIQNNLKVTAEKELSQSIIDNMKKSNEKLGKAYFDNSAGFVNLDISSVLFEDEDDFLWE